MMSDLNTLRVCANRDLKVCDLFQDCSHVPQLKSRREFIIVKDLSSLFICHTAEKGTRTTFVSSNAQ